MHNMPPGEVAPPYCILSIFRFLDMPAHYYPAAAFEILRIIPLNINP